jgi:hypothetical protein
MPTTGKKRAIRHAFHRLGLHTAPRAVARALAQQGVQVGGDLVRQVRIEMLKEAARPTVAPPPRPVHAPAVRRCPQGFPRH